ncbi:MAG: Stp1/IreP family PP2C-type Ser/Thr phosphatase [Bacteroidota bacterium]
MSFLFRKKKRSALPESKSTTLSWDYKAVAATDVGSVRDNNEDYLLFSRPFDKGIRNSHGCLALVADGMGGHSSGEIASKMATEIISRSYFDSKYGILEALRKAFEKANKAIYQKAAKRPRLKGMGTTCTALVLRENHMYLAHVGDSRAYLLKGNRLIQLSTDHTYVQHLLDSGQISHKESLSHPQRNVITRAMGTSPKVDAEYQQLSHTFEEGDRLLICSDGLYEYIQEQELGQILSGKNMNELAQMLISIAKKRGGHDNISVLIAEAIKTSSGEEAKETQKINLS